MFKVPTCVDPQRATPIRVNNCPRNENSDNWLTPVHELDCYSCNPFGVHANDRMQDGCYKWAFKIQCNEENRRFVQSQWVQHPERPCGTTEIVCHSIRGDCTPRQRCFRGYGANGELY